MKKTLIFDIDISGHHIEYLSHLINYLNGKSATISGQYVFIVHPKFSHYINKYTNIEGKSNISVVPIKLSEYDNIINEVDVKTSISQSLNARVLSSLNPLAISKCCVFWDSGYHFRIGLGIENDLLSSLSRIVDDLQTE